METQRERELSEESFAQIKKYTYKYNEDKNYYIELDCTRFINHSKNPNIKEDENRNDVAIKDIKKGEEFLIDYTSFYDLDYLKDESYL